jgi:circadian clock protein KaiB
MSQRAKFKFRLYVAADTLNSGHAIANLNALCKTHLAGRYDIEIVDVFKEPQRALAEGIRMTPTLLKLAPSPLRRIVGTLSQTQRVLDTLGLETGTL